MLTALGLDCKILHTQINFWHGYQEENHIYYTMSFVLLKMEEELHWQNSLCLK